VNSLESALAHIGRSLDEIGRPWALVGALAVAARAEARATLDVDVAIAVDDAADAARVVSHLRALAERANAAELDRARAAIKLIGVRTGSPVAPLETRLADLLAELRGGTGRGPDRDDEGT